MTKTITFWFDFLSPGSYISAQRIDDAAATRRVAVDWKPFQTGSPDLAQKSALATRTAIAMLSEDWGKTFCQAIFAAKYERGLDIANPLVVGDCIEAAGGVSQIYLFMGHANSMKQKLREHMDEAQRLGLIKAPSFVIDSTVFTGDERLDDALEHTAQS